MRRTLTVLRAALALAASLLLVGAVAAPAGARHPEIVQPFKADFNTFCTSTWTQGELGWKAWHPPDTPGVHVWGEVGDVNVCFPDDRAESALAFAEFTAYIGRTVVDREIQRVDLRNNPTPFRFTLESDGASIVARDIDRVTVRACRDLGFMLPAFQCGQTQTYYPNVIGPRP